MSEPASKKRRTRRRIGIVGFGSLGRYLAEKVLTDEAASNKLELVWVWNRSADKLKCHLLKTVTCLENLDDFEKHSVDLIVEVAHPQITKDYGVRFVQHADYFIGSPTALADADLEGSLRSATAHDDANGIYVPSGIIAARFNAPYSLGALWGAQDIAKMAQLGTLGGVTVTMKKHPSSLKLKGDLMVKLQNSLKEAESAEVLLYSGSVRALCPLAPNNVNTMAAAALAGLGFDDTQARLVCDARLESHDILIEVRGKPRPNGTCFEVNTKRINPAGAGAVTGTATYASFLSSLYRAHGLGNGVHLC